MKRWRLVHKKTGQLCVHQEVDADSIAEAELKFMELIGQLPSGTVVVCVNEQE